MIPTVQHVQMLPQQAQMLPQQLAALPVPAAYHPPSAIVGMGQMSFS
jgi:hypothetical protein